MSTIIENKEQRVAQTKVNGMGDLGMVIKGYCDSIGLDRPEKVVEVLAKYGVEMTPECVEDFYSGDYDLTLKEFGAFHSILNLNGNDLFEKVGKLHGLNV
ncbi:MULTISPECIES: hypothetical protein [Butyrivibrio]|jgi:hypothetical protein|uniref:hypothetical protein n=1 Tax=Butyrivibrio TaxID=830 RepID=UPI0003B4855F|nr:MULTISPECIES: hypothetical protein [Butyrivibrio]SEQ01126.1 hypothetical protein SAMN02910382_01712 [Butyrivibrio sp. TB]